MANRTSLDLTMVQPSYWPGVIGVPGNAPADDPRGADGKVFFLVFFWFALAASLAILAVVFVAVK